jgi:hypothetical protein
MKKTFQKKLILGKVTIQNLGDRLDRRDQEMVKGGSDPKSGFTNIPIFCK